MKKLVLVLLLNLLIVPSALAECEIFQTMDGVGRARLLGNAVPLTNSVLVMNEHSLYPDTVTLRLQSHKRSITGRVLFRDHHTDLAFVRVNEYEVMGCGPSIQAFQIGYTTFLRGFQAGENTPYEMIASIKNSYSQRGTVIGIPTMIEIQFLQQGVLEKTMSGSALLDSMGGFYGILSQRTWNGTGLVIKYDQIRQAYARGAVARKYSLSKDRKTAIYAGLEFTLDRSVADNQLGGNIRMGRDNLLASGNPHEGRFLKSGNPHEGYFQEEEPNVFVSGVSPEAGAVLAKVVDWNRFKEVFPKVASLVSNGDYIEIISFNDAIVRTPREFLRLVEDSNEERLSEYILRRSSDVPADAASLRSVERMFELIQKEHGKVFMMNISNLKNRLTTSVQRALENRRLGRKNPDQLRTLTREWIEIRQFLDKKRHSEDLMQEIFKFQAFLLSFEN